MLLVQDAEPCAVQSRTSGVASFALRELPIDLKELEINGDNSYGYAPLQQAIAAHHALIQTASWNLRAHLWRIISPWPAIIEPGDEVLIEHPAYGPILDIAHYL